MHSRLTALSASALGVGVAFMPLLASAQTLLNTLALVSTFLNAVVYLFITLAIVVFFWGLIRYVLVAGPDGKKDALNIMMYGLIAIFVMVSIWGIIRLLQSTFRVTSTEPVIPKTIQLDTRFVQ